ncbi:MAG: hypothetical protein HY021_16730 [Burkholderiales bacterium]|nr:hypothetical protein [Burkholderiales bacterium]
MRTTLNLEDDALLAAKQHAAREGVSLGEAASRLIRMGLRAHAARPATAAATLKGRFALLPSRDEVITVEHIRDLLDREGL